MAPARAWAKAGISAPAGAPPSLDAIYNISYSPYFDQSQSFTCSGQSLGQSWYQCSGQSPFPLIYSQCSRYFGQSRSFTCSGQSLGQSWYQCSSQSSLSPSWRIQTAGLFGPAWWPGCGPVPPSYTSSLSPGLGPSCPWPPPLLAPAPPGGRAGCWPGT